MTNIDGTKIAILATDGFEQSELEEPRRLLTEAGAIVHVVAPHEGEIRGWSGDDWGEPVPVNRTLDDVLADDYDALVLPGGVINPDQLRMNERAVKLVQGFYREGKTIGAICHGPWMLAEANLVHGRHVTSWPSLRTDLTNAGGLWEDSPVVAHEGVVTSRNPGDIPAFVRKIIEEIQEGAHASRFQNRELTELDPITTVTSNEVK